MDKQALQNRNGVVKTLEQWDAPVCEPKEEVVIKKTTKKKKKSK